MTVVIEILVHSGKTVLKAFLSEGLYDVDMNIDVSH